MVFDITDPQAVTYVDYVNDRNWDAVYDGAAVPDQGDLGAEGVGFISGPRPDDRRGQRGVRHDHPLRGRADPEVTDAGRGRVTETFRPCPALTPDAELGVYRHHRIHLVDHRALFYSTHGRRLTVHSFE
ncbi:hypothetical protein GCM10009609_15460 [Pseudonocardia aurantiaca]